MKEEEKRYFWCQKNKKGRFSENPGPTVSEDGRDEVGNEAPYQPSCPTLRTE